MKITHVITGLNDGGAEATLFKLCENDPHNEHSVIALMGRGKYATKLEEIGVSVVVLGIPRRKIACGRLFRLFKVIRDGRPDLVQTWMYHADLTGGLLARLAGVKAIVWNVRQSRLEKPFAKRTTIWTAKLLGLLSRFIPLRIIACASEAVDLHLALGYPREKIRYVSNGYAVNDVRPDSVARKRMRERIGVSEKTPVLGMVANFKPSKDHQNLLNALGLLKKREYFFQCVLAGSGMNQENNELMGWIVKRDLGDRVILLDQRDDVPVIMNGIDLHVLSSTTEGFPNVVAEAMACGTPCVVTKVGDAGNIVGTTGWLVQRHDPSALANGIEAALTQMNDVKSWRRRCRNARARIVENFSVECMVKAYTLVWEEAREEAARRS